MSFASRWVVLRRFDVGTSDLDSDGVVRAESVVLHDRVPLRPTDGDGDDAINAACEVSLEEPETGEAPELGDDIRDELIALEHAASHIV
jgi:hypothetical protein